ncbi:MAG: 2-dehydro-3-deoxy-6-phosphogalactonate aldolase [Burkholderiales bacterium]
MLAFQEAVSRCPLIAILRGVKPGEVLEIGNALAGAGFSLIEVPLNSPRPFESIRILADALGTRAMIGAGTVLQEGQADRVAQAGGSLIVMPHADARIVRRAKQLGLYALPGFATPTEAFAMLEAGADGLKLFPAEANPPSVLKAMRAVLPRETLIFPVGSITPDNMRGYLDAGANGFGLGSALYKAGSTPAQVAISARRFTDSLRGTLSV